MNALRIFFAAGAVAALAAPAFAGSTPPTPTPVAPGFAEGVLAVTPAQAQAALQALRARELPATLPAALKAQALQVLAAIQADPGLLARLGVTPEQLAELIGRVNAIPVSG